MKIKKNSSIILFIVLFSCGTKYSNKEEYPITKISPIDTLTFPVDANTDYKALFPTYDSNNNSIWTLNILNNRLYEYDIESKESKYIEFDENLEIGSIVGYNLIGKDSIAFLNKRNDLVISNRKGEFLESHPIKSSDIPGLPLLFPTFMEGIISPKETILINNYSISESGDLAVKILHDTDEIIPLAKIPAEFFEGFYGYKSYSFFSALVNEEGFIVNFPNLNELYIYDYDFNLKKKIEIEEMYKKDIIKIFPNKLSMAALKVRPSESEVDRIESQYLDNVIFRRFLYNPWKKEYYRLIGYPISQGLQDMKDPVKSFIRQYSVMVFDENLKVKGEFGLEYNRYLIESGGLISIPEGLAIQVDNTEKEDIMIFEIFSFDNLK